MVRRPTAGVVRRFAAGTAAIALLVTACSRGPAAATSTVVPGAGSSAARAVTTATAPAPARSALTATATIAAPRAPGGVKVTEREFAIDAPEQVAAGTVTFVVSNAGAVAHNFTVIRTDLPADQLPVANGTIDLSKVQVVAQTKLDVQPGQTAEVSAKLPSGSYVLICDIPGHYQLGMRVALTVP